MLVSSLERVFELHVHDNDGTGDHHRPIGTGNFPFHELLKWLEEIEGEKPVINLENKSIQDIALALQNFKEVKGNV
jgi:sugar phosphate isomerase/epimerase